MTPPLPSIATELTARLAFLGRMAMRIVPLNHGAIAHMNTAFGP